MMINQTDNLVDWHLQQILKGIKSVQYEALISATVRVYEQLTPSLSYPFYAPTLFLIFTINIRQYTQ